MTDIFKTIETLKNQTGAALAKSYALLPVNFSEKTLTDAWLTELRADRTLHDDGWYAPPPHGIITVFGQPDDNYTRITQPSFRPTSMWPRDNIHYDDESIIALYASPIHRETNLIGDFGLNIYRGTNPALKDHFENVLRATLHIADHARPGMAFRELYKYAMHHGDAQGFANNITSTTDPTGTNIGHSIPLSYKTDATYNAITTAKSYDDIKDTLSKGRKFLNSAETQIIEENMAFTIEPRFSTPSLPNVWFHLTVILGRGEKRICHGFAPIFQSTGMDFLSKFLP